MSDTNLIHVFDTSWIQICVQYFPIHTHQVSNSFCDTFIVGKIIYTDIGGEVIYNHVYVYQLLICLCIYEKLAMDLYKLWIILIYLVCVVS